MKDLLEGFLKATENVESPTVFLRWALFAAVGAVLRDNIYIPIKSQHRRVYPNLYVLLYADSGASRKSAPLKIVNKLLKVANNTKLIEGRASIQGVLKILHEATRLEDGRMLKDASGIMYSEELASFLVKDPQTSGIMTDIFDYHETWDISLKGDEVRRLKNVCVSLLSATNGVFFQDMFQKTDMYGGLVGRILIIEGEGPRKKASGFEKDEDPDEDLIDRTNWEELENHFKLLSKKRGEILLTKSAKSYYNEWYRSTDFTINDSKTGFEHRIHTYVLKLAIILAACELDFQLLIEQEHIERAIEYVVPLKQVYLKLAATTVKTQNNIAEVSTQTIRILLESKNYILSRKSLAQRLMGLTDIETLDKAVFTLEQTGYIQVESYNGTAHYRVTPLGLERILNKMTPEGRA